LQEHYLFFLTTNKF